MDSARAYQLDEARAKRMLVVDDTPETADDRRKIELRKKQASASADLLPLRLPQSQGVNEKRSDLAAYCSLYLPLDRPVLFFRGSC